MTITLAQATAYEAYIAAGKALYAAINPTDEELEIAIGQASQSPGKIVEEYFCSSGFTAVYIYDMRQSAEEFVDE